MPFIALWQNRRRVGLFGLNGLMCLFIQLLVLKLLKSGGLTPYWADALAFIISAQFNFVFSNWITWRDKWSDSGTTLFRRWKGFNFVALLAMLANAGIYTALQGDAPDRWVVLVSTAITTVMTFLLLHNVVYATKREQRYSEKLKRPEASIAWFLPAHDESPNLAWLVPETVEYLSSLGNPFRIIIVNDGSTNGTAKVSNQLAEQFPEVQVVHHATNLGYGVALKSGFTAALSTGYNLIGFMDSDGQFRIDSLGPMLKKIRRNHAVFGHRENRADERKRLWAGRAWHHLSSFVLRFDVDDTDCGMKLFRSEVIEAILPRLRAKKGGISAEMLAWIHWESFRTTDIVVNHYPRAAGNQSGLKPSVIAQSFVDLAITRCAMWWASVVLRTSRIFSLSVPVQKG